MSNRRRNKKLKMESVSLSIKSHRSAKYFPFHIVNEYDFRINECAIFYAFAMATAAINVKVLYKKL